MVWLTEILAKHVLEHTVFLGWSVEPAADIFTIVLQEGNAIHTLVRLDILNMQGQVVFHDTLSNFPTPQLVWKNDGLPSGTYLVHVYVDKQLIGQQKIVLH